MDTQRIRELIPVLYKVVHQLEDAAEGRKCTPDGHMVGSLGEVMAVARFGLKLNVASTEGFDAIASDKRKVEIKTTQQERGYFALKPPCWPDLHLIAIKLNPIDGSDRVVFNGPYELVWENCGPLQKWGGRTITVARAEKLQRLVSAEERLRELN